MSRALLRATIVVVMLAIVAGGALGVAPASVQAANQPQPAATSFPLTAELSLNADSDLYPNYVPGVPMSLVAGNGDQSAAHFQELFAAVWVDLDAATWVVAGQVNNVDVYQATYQIPSPTAGDHSYRIQIDGGASVDIAVHVALVAETVAIDGPTSVQAHHAISLTASLTGSPISIAPTGTIAWRDADTHALLETDDLALGTPTRTFTPTVVGVKHIEAVYSGDAVHEPATSPAFTVTITVDTVQVSGVGVDLATFYPKVDGYRDVVHARGTRLEKASVSVRIYNSTNHLVRTLAVASGTGAYSVGWNGKTTSGVLAPAGSYRISQVFTDTSSVHKTVNSTVTLSWKQLYFTTKTLTKYADAASSVGYAGAGYALKYSDHSIRIHASGGWVGVGWQFALPSATTYKSLSVGVYGASGAPIGHFGAQNFSWCAYSSTWNEACFDHMTGMRTTTGWSSRAVSPTYNRYGHAVRLIYSQYGGASHLYKVRVIVTYGILK